MELTNVEAAVCIKALQLAAKWERKQGDNTMAEAYMEMRKTLFARYAGKEPTRHARNAAERAEEE